MKTATYIVTAKSGKTYKWTFEECIINTEDYGNKRYIAYTMPSGDKFLLDCRYAQKYDFNKICVDFLLEWYGENFAELCEEDEGNEEDETNYLYKRFINEDDLHHWSND